MGNVIFLRTVLGVGEDGKFESVLKEYSDKVHAEENEDLNHKLYKLIYL